MCSVVIIHNRLVARTTRLLVCTTNCLYDLRVRSVSMGSVLLLLKSTQVFCILPAASTWHGCLDHVRN